MTQMEQPERLRPDRPVTVDDVRQLMGSSTPHFALQIRTRLQRLVERLAADDPVRQLAETEIARLNRLAVTGEIRGEGPQPGQRPLPSLGADEPTPHPGPIDDEQPVGFNPTDRQIG